LAHPDGKQGISYGAEYGDAGQHQILAQGHGA
jgi:hypothetical protein